MKNIFTILCSTLLLMSCTSQDELVVVTKTIEVENGDTLVTEEIDTVLVPKDSVLSENQISEVRVMITGPKSFDSLRKIEGAQLIDVRTLAEFNAGHIEGAIHADILNGSFDKELNNLNKNQAVLVYCKSGGRSTRARKSLEELKFKYIVELEGGYSGYSKFHNAK